MRRRKTNKEVMMRVILRMKNNRNHFNQIKNNRTLFLNNHNRQAKNLNYKLKIIERKSMTMNVYISYIHFYLSIDFS